MTKLITLFAIAALSTSIGCKHDKDKEAKATAPVEKPTEAKPDDKAAKPDDKKPDDKATPVSAGDLPKECNDYKDAIAKLAACDKMPAQARDALKQAYDQAAAGWTSLPAEAKANLATACKAGADAVQTSGKATCGW